MRNQLCQSFILAIGLLFMSVLGTTPALSQSTNTPTLLGYPDTNGWILRGGVDEQVQLNAQGSRIVASAPLPGGAAKYEQKMSMMDVAGTFSLKTFFIYGHLIGLAIGLGVALFLDYYLLRYAIFSPVSSQLLQTVRSGSSLVKIGLGILWFTGIGFLVIYWFTDPGKLANQKIWAKVTIVTLLTINGLVIERYILPFLEERNDRLAFSDVNWNIRLIAALAGAVSITSWLTATFMGIAKELNFTLTADSILMGYLTVLACVAALVFFVIELSRSHQEIGQDSR